MAKTPAADKRLLKKLNATRDSGTVATTKLHTDTRVLARVTDGIYRQPASALRELISNAYDADATRVVITTDRPRFQRIVVDDDGLGMSPEALVHMLHHIGGSAKRSDVGAELGVTSASSPAFSPGGRRLIGKIGIGLFSIAQLTQAFQVITKVKGDSWRTIATVTLRQYTDTELADSAAEYEAGQVAIWQEPATDIEASGTRIVLDKIRPKTRESLQTAGQWIRVEKGEAQPPRYHIGRYSPSDRGELLRFGSALNNVPWNEGDDPVQAFKALVDSAWSALDLGETNPKLDQLYDHYLQMVWQLSLAVPAPYVDGHPLDLELSDVPVYELPGDIPSSARHLDLTKKHKTVRSAVGYNRLPSDTPNFKVIVDDLELRRPLRFKGLPTTTNQVKHPILFVGHLREEFPSMDPEMSGGPLEFQAYLLWAPKIAPVDHVGALVRVHGASGTLFDPNFLRFQVAEVTRLRQISCEIFVSEGLESALNIDRESFNFTHPHYVRLTNWLHNALTRAITQQKSVAAHARSEARKRSSRGDKKRLEQIVAKVWEEIAGSVDDVPEVTFSSRRSSATPMAGSFLFDRSDVLGSAAFSSSQANRMVEARLRSIVQVLAAYNAFEDMSLDEQAVLVKAVADILRVGV